MKLRVVDPPNALFITRRFPPATGGMERFAYDLHQALATQTTTYLLAWGGGNLALFWVLPYFFVRSCWILLTRRPAIIHAQDGVVSIMAVPLKWLFRRPLCVVIHGLDVTYKNRLFQALIVWSLSQADSIICISGAAREEVLKRGVEPSKVKVIPLGITDDLFMNNKLKAQKAVAKLTPDLPADAKRLVSVGRLVERKGIQWFVSKVLPLVVAAEPKAVLLVVGEGPMQAAIAKEVQIRKLQQHVQLLGRLDDDQVRLIYNAADCFVMPNFTVPGDMEGFGRVLLEAALCEVPVVASGIEGITDAIIDGRNGLLIRPKNAKDQAAAITRILANPTGARRAGAKARRYTLEHFNWVAVADQYQIVYRQVLEARR